MSGVRRHPRSDQALVTLTVVALAQRIHAEWRSARATDGWRLGAADAQAKTSPYLKPLVDFTPLEWRRERWLALTDLLTITGVKPRALASLRIEPAALRRVAQPFPPDNLDSVAMRVHQAWRVINRHFGFADPRADHPFADLAPAAQARCRANVVCDIEAIASLARELHPGKIISITVCEDMHADAALLAAAIDVAPQGLRNGAA